jgi:hypothetical protein
VSGYTFSFSCPDCGGDLEHRRSIRTSPTRSSAECWCSVCLIVWQLDLGATAIDTLAGMVLAASSDERRRDRAALALGNDLGAFQ